MKIPDRLIAFRVFDEAGKFIGVSDVDLPDIESLTETLKGAGIAGEIDLPTLGQTASMETTLNFKTMNDSQLNLMKPQGTTLDFRGSLQQLNSAKAKIEPIGIKLTMSLFPKKLGLGKFETGSPMDSDSAFEVLYLKMYIGGKEALEIDKANYIYRINGHDYLEEVRSQLGLN